MNPTVLQVRLLRASRLAAIAVLLATLVFAAACSKQPPAGLAASGDKTPTSQKEAVQNTPDPAILPEFQPVSGRSGLQRQIDLHTIMPDRPRLDVIKYLVKEGDTLFGIAEKFGLDPQSVLWGNWDTLEADPHTLRPGQELNIPPVDGVLYPWKVYIC